MISNHYRVERLHASSFRGYQWKQRRPCRYCYGQSTIVVNPLDVPLKEVLKESGPEPVLAKDPYRGHKIDIRI